MLASAVELLASGSELHCTGSHICQLELLGIADYIVFLIGFATFVSNTVRPSYYAQDRSLKSVRNYLNGW